MKKMILLCTVMLGFSLSGCSPKAEEDVPTIASGLVVKAASEEITTRSSSSDAMEQVVFTGDDILWFNGTTKEIRFKDNYSNNPQNNNIISGVFSKGIKFYIDGEYLFSSMICVSSLNSQTYNSLVFYYNIMENKFYLTDGYPEASVLSDPQKAQAERDKNTEKIKDEWNKFIEQMKKEGRYKN